MTSHTLLLACYQVLAPCGWAGSKNTTEDTGISLHCHLLGRAWARRGSLEQINSSKGPHREMGGRKTPTGVSPSPSSRAQAEADSRSHAHCRYSCWHRKPWTCQCRSTNPPAPCRGACSPPATAAWPAAVPPGGYFPCSWTPGRKAAPPAIKVRGHCASANGAWGRSKSVTDSFRHSLAAKGGQPTQRARAEQVRLLCRAARRKTTKSLMDGCWAGSC